MGKLDVELRGLQGLAALIDGGIRDRLALVQDQPAIEITFRQFYFGLRIGELAVSLLGDGLERARINHIEQVSGVDHSAIAKLNGSDETADLGANLDLLDGLEPSAEFVPLGDGAFDRSRDGH